MTIALENIDMAMIYLVDDNRKEAILQAQRNIPEDYIRRVERIPYPKGVTWRVINAGRMLNIEDVQKDPDIGSVGRDLGHHGVLGIPIFLEERVIGVIWFVSYKERKFNQREVSLLSTLGNQIGVAISKAKQRKESELINKDLSALNTIATSVHRSLTLKEVYSIALDTVLGITAFDIAMVYLVDENTNEAVLQAHRGLTEDYIRRAGRILYPKGVTWRVINSGELTLIDDTQKDPDLGPAGRTLGHHTILMLPIKQEEKTIGVINFASRRVLELSSRDVNLLNAIGNQIGTAIVQAYLYEKSQKQAEELRTLYEDLNRRNKDLEILNAITQAVHQSLSLEEVYKVALDMTIALENIDMAMIYLVDDNRKEAILQAQRNIPEDYKRRAERIPYPKGITWKVIEGGEILNVRDAQTDPNIGPAGRELGHHSILGIPITLEGVVIGVIWFLSYKERQFNKQEIDLLTSIGNQIAIAIARAKIFKELKRQEEALRESEERYRTLVEHTYDLIIETNTDGQYLYVSPKHKDMLGYDPSELVGGTIFEHVHQDDRSAVMAEFQRAIRTFTSGHAVYRFRHKNGQWLWLESTGKPYQTATGEVRGVIASRDITERKRAEEELKSSREQLRALAASLQSAREEERSRIAREIHDNLGQALTGLKMSLSWLDKKLSEVGDGVPPSLLLNEIASMSKLIDAAIQMVREISAELRPGVLDDLGLVAAVEWQAQEFQTRMGIRCRFTSTLGNITLDKEQSTAIFRILQETLTNVARHANATRVNITLRKKAGNLILEVRDNGRGITESEISNPRSLGLLGMRERALLLGGDVEISGTPGKGTAVTVQIPY
jgi:PAS domain S-box-containing protein